MPKTHNQNSNTAHAIYLYRLHHISFTLLSFPLLVRNPNRLPRSSLNRHVASAPIHPSAQSIPIPLSNRKTYLRNNLTIGLHVTTPGCGTPSSGGLHEYCVISYSGHSLRSTRGPFRRFSWKFFVTMLTCSGNEVAEWVGRIGAILRVGR